MSAIYWARIGAVYYSSDWKATQSIGFADDFQYEDFAKPPNHRSITLEQINPELGEQAYQAWMNKPDHHPY
jgi:tRNA(Arg) A34 adenosine deaminase TadA